MSGVVYVSPNDNIYHAPGNYSHSGPVGFTLCGKRLTMKWYILDEETHMVNCPKCLKMIEARK